MKKKILGAVFGCFLAVISMSGTASVAQAAHVGPALVIKKGQVLRGHFSEEHMAKPLNKMVRTEGQFAFAPEYGVLWQVLKPLPVTLVITDQGIEQSLAGVPLLRLTKAQMPFLEDAPRLLFAALQGRWRDLEKDFTVTTAGKSQAWQAELRPQKTSDARALFTTLSVKGGKYVDLAEVTRKDGYKDRFVFTNQVLSTSPLADDELLLFDQTKGGQSESLQP